ncbi:MAG TPA: hypothetical protein VFP09_10040, partial [Desertimonas sp.]|nr:hypothetical protein [Desertimonas sp.]
MIHARAGNGGNGCASVHREKFKPLGGPDGGNGGRGGSIVLVVDPQVHTLLDFHFHPHVVAPSGKQGMGGNRDGAAGADLEVKVPDGTVVLDEHGRLLADLAGAGTRFEAAAGGRGGSIVLVVDPQVHTLLDFHFHPHVVAPSGRQGAGSNRDGAA